MRIISLLSFLLALFRLAAVEPESISMLSTTAHVYVGNEIRIRLTVPGQPQELRWAAELYGAKVAGGILKKDPVEGWMLIFIAPKLKRAAEISVLVAEMDGKRLVSQGTMNVRVYPPFDWSRLRGGQEIGVAAKGGVVVAAFKNGGVDLLDVSGRLALQAFSGNTLILDGSWLADEGQELADELRAHLKRNARILVLNPIGVPVFFENPMPMAAGPFNDIVADDTGEKNGAFLKGWFAEGHRKTAVDAKISIGGNFKTYYSGKKSIRVNDNDSAKSIDLQPAIIGQVWPRDGGTVVLSACPVAEQLESNPAAPEILAYGLHLLNEKQSWRPVVSMNLNDEFSRLLKGLGVHVSAHDGKQPLPNLDSIIFISGNNRPSASLLEWVEAGGTVVVTLSGIGAERIELVRPEKVINGVHDSLLRQLAENFEKGQAWQASDWSEKRTSIIGGLLDVVELGKGSLFLLRTGPFEKPPTAAWTRYLSIVLTNLRIRLLAAE